MSEREQEGEGGYRPDFQRQPCVEWQEGAQRFIEERHEGEKERPVTRQLQPALVRKAVVGCLQQIFEQGLFLSQPTEKHQSKKGVYHCRLALDESLIVEVDGETANADHQHGRKTEHGRAIAKLFRRYNDSED